MKKAEAITRLEPFERRLRERDIKALYLFGSTQAMLQAETARLREGEGGDH